MTPAGDLKTCVVSLAELNIVVGIRRESAQPASIGADDLGAFLLAASVGKLKLCAQAGLIHEHLTVRFAVVPAVCGDRAEHIVALTDY